MDGQLSYDAIVQDGQLVIPVVQMDDAGTYRCTGSDGEVAFAELIVIDSKFHNKHVPEYIDNFKRLLYTLSCPKQQCMGSVNELTCMSRDVLIRAVYNSSHLIIIGPSA